MKEQRYEKVVEWEKEPDWSLVILVNVLFISPLFIIHIDSYIGGLMDGIIIMLYIYVMKFALTSRRKVYWRKI